MKIFVRGLLAAALALASAPALAQTTGSIPVIDGTKATQNLATVPCTTTAGQPALCYKQSAADASGNGITSTAGTGSNAGKQGFDVNVLNPSTASANASGYFPESTTALAAGATFTGSAHDGGVSPSQWASFTCLATADQASAANGLRAQVSPDGTAWTTGSAGTLLAGGIASAQAPLVARYGRCVFVNGTTAQNSFSLNSRFGSSN